MNTLVTDGWLDPPNDFDWWWCACIDDVLDNEKSREKLAQDFLVDVLKYHHWNDLLQIVVEEMSYRARQHKAALMNFTAGWVRGYGDHPMRVPIIKSTMRAFAGYMQLVYLANNSVPTLLAAFADKALIFQGRK